MVQMLAVALLLATASGARVSAPPKVIFPPGSYIISQESEPKQQEMLEGLGCYCKKVASMDDCPDYQEGKKETEPEHPHWFHSNAANAEKKPHFCCKLDSTSWSNHVGFKYHRQANLTLCTYETRKVPQEACCRVGKLDNVGLRVKDVEMVLNLEILNWENEGNKFFKSYPIFLSSDITGGTDYDGSSVSAEDAQKFFQNEIKGGAMAGTTPYCAKPFAKMIEDTDDCRLRKDPPTQCCCLQESILPAEGCLALPESRAKTPPQIVVVNGSYTEQEVHGHRQGTITRPQSPVNQYQDDRKIKSKDPNSTMESLEMEFEWFAPKEKQWTSRCLSEQIVKEVKSHVRVIGEASDGTPRYYQESSKECISYEYARTCPPGHAYAFKEIPRGTCTKRPGPSNSDELQLNDLGGLTYECPEGYKSNNKKSQKFDSHCLCEAAVRMSGSADYLSGCPFQ